MSKEKRYITTEDVHAMHLALSTFKHKPGARDLERNPAGGGEWLNLNELSLAWNELLDKKVITVPPFTDKNGETMRDHEEIKRIKDVWIGISDGKDLIIKKLKKENKKFEKQMLRNYQMTDHYRQSANWLRKKNKELIELLGEAEIAVRTLTKNWSLLDRMQNVIKKSKKH